MTTDTTHRIDELRAERRAAAVRYLDALREIEEPLATLVQADAELRAAACQAGMGAAAGPELKSLAAEVLLGAAAPLRPHVAFTTEAAVRRAAEELRSR